GHKRSLRCRHARWHRAAGRRGPRCQGPCRRRPRHPRPGRRRSRPPTGNPPETAGPSTPGLRSAGRLPSVPLVLEEVEMKTARGMLGDQVLVDCDAETGPGREREAPIDDLGVAWGRFFDESLGEVVEVLLDLEV